MFEVIVLCDEHTLNEADNGSRYIFTAGDYFTKWVEAVPIADKSASAVAAVLFKIFMRMGLPQVIISDQGSEFSNRLDSSLAELVGIKRKLTTPYHPQYKNVQHQYGGSDCGLFALAFATALSASTDPTACTFDQGLMREHFLKCIKKGKMDPFLLKQPRRPISRLVKVEIFDIHCHCRMTENQTDKMILCNGNRKQWYHSSCDHIEESIKFWNSRRRWYCRNCKK